jgi:hypothetical protein
MGPLSAETIFAQEGEQEKMAYAPHCCSWATSPVWLVLGHLQLFANAYPYF